MSKSLIAALLSAAVLPFISCKLKETPAAKPSASPIQSETRQCMKRYCASDEHCANFSIYFPQFIGGDSATTNAVTESYRSFILSTVGGNPNLPFEVALDSAGIYFCNEFAQVIKENPEMPLGYDFTLVSNVLVNNPKIITLEMSGNSYTGGAHPNSFATLVTYDLQNKGTVLPVTAFVNDTTAVLPLLEKAYKQSKGMTETGKIAELLYPELTQLPLPRNIGIVPEGIRFYYSDYEVAPHAVGPADIILSWGQLGGLADQKKWF